MKGKGKFQLTRQKKLGKERVAGKETDRPNKTRQAQSQTVKSDRSERGDPGWQARAEKPSGRNENAMGWDGMGWDGWVQTSDSKEQARPPEVNRRWISIHEAIEDPLIIHSNGSCWSGGRFSDDFWTGKRHNSEQDYIMTRILLPWLKLTKKISVNLSFAPTIIG
ncbi:uncharacterized protein ATNIH1004_010033 [Aspergillus tanneri]|uniref:Uncharacterized protein n=1 Tax=Aspergillus tanneri TaxID=1220188 RepID=A0A5M9MC30_9EURO|nr:uncharacterized protein ATNIH1004_010033 [Aspergillus tanneri]KAA8643266.1 hypothetical protein ATNIH1004_010033 [Aspergillus tanneri]